MKLTYITYLQKTFGFEIKLKSKSTPKHIPAFVTTCCSFQSAFIEYVEVLFVLINEPLTLIQIKAIYKNVWSICKKNTVLVSRNFNSRQCKALIQQRMPYVYASKQAYLPFLGFAATSIIEQSVVNNKFTPSTQAILAVMLVNNKINNIKQLQKLTLMSKATITRALATLENKDLIERSKNGKEVFFKFLHDFNSTIKHARKFCSTPVSKEFFVLRTKEIDKLPISGESALSNKTNLTKPSISVRAISSSEIKEIEYTECLEGQYSNNKTIKLQVWKYNPLIAGKKTIDKFSLGLTFLNETDERITKELNSLFNEEDLWYF